MECVAKKGKKFNKQETQRQSLYSSKFTALSVIRCPLKGTSFIVAADIKKKDW